tara:strand:- start:156 stop:326 length:171 start_codon:yes stop_codon:yes gene_type:complete
MMKKIEAILSTLVKKVDMLEKDSHPCKELHEFDAYPPLMAKIEALSQRIKALEEKH